MAHSTPIHPYRVLVVALDSGICRLVVEVLTLEGYRADMAVIDGQVSRQARATLRGLKQADRPIILLVDSMTFNIAGAEPLADYLRDVERRAPHLLFLMTVYHGTSARSMVEWLHADGLLLMPFSVEVLVNVILEGECILNVRQPRLPEFTSQYVM